jgi:threonine synthase
MSSSTRDLRPVIDPAPMTSLATGQRSIHDPSLTYPLWPPLTAGCPRSSTEHVAYPLEVDYEYSALGADDTRRLFARDRMPEDVGGWSQLLPPLRDELTAGIGSTPLVAGPVIDGIQVLVKDESRNPTWSHKDRLNLCTVSAAALSGAPGVVVASSGNHGASAAALAARAGLPCVVVMADNGPALPQAFVAAYGAVVLPVSRDARWPVMRAIVDRLGFQPLSNQTATHTGHPFGPEGYKTIAYELYLQLGHRLPAAVFVPTGYAELLYGVWKGFQEMVRLGVVPQAPALFACEVAGRGVLAEALRTGDPAVTVAATPTDAYSVATTTGGYRGLHVMRHTSGRVIGVDDPSMERAQDDLAALGLWQELSGAIGVAGVRQLVEAGGSFDGPVVCIATSSGLKDKNALRHLPAPASPDWHAIVAELRRHGVAVS